MLPSTFWAVMLLFARVLGRSLGMRQGLLAAKAFLPPLFQHTWSDYPQQYRIGVSGNSVKGMCLVCNSVFERVRAAQPGTLPPLSTIKPIRERESCTTSSSKSPSSVLTQLDSARTTAHLERDANNITISNFEWRRAPSPPSANPGVGYGCCAHGSDRQNLAVSDLQSRV